MMDPLDRQKSLYDAVDARRDDLGWPWRDLVDATGVTYETFRALTDNRVRRMRASTKRQIEAGLGWETGSVDVIMAGSQATLIRGWRPFRQQGDDRSDYERTLLAATGLSAADLSEAQQRYKAGHTWIRVIAEAVAEVAGGDIDEGVREVLLIAAGESIRHVFEAERREQESFTQMRRAANRHLSTWGNTEA